ELLETQMGVQLAAIRKLPALSPQDKFLQQGNSLEGAHLPRRGFYYLKPSKATEMSSSSSERLTHSTTGTRGSWLTPWRPQEQGPATAHTSCELTSNGMDELQDHT
ncbi:hypothetical protein MMC14_010284, partial [Varicellaria rhodocarpa]|nr:hypothetical protein [Varicellaria rhodocarpa]